MSLQHVIISCCLPPFVLQDLQITVKMIQINILYACTVCTTTATLSLSTAAYITYSCRPTPLFPLVHTIALHAKLLATAPCISMALKKLTHANFSTVAQTWLPMCSVVFFTHAVRIHVSPVSLTLSTNKGFRKRQFHPHAFSNVLWRFASET